jgi:hypothetical protein
MAIGAVFAANITSSAPPEGGLGKDLRSLQKALAVGRPAHRRCKEKRSGSKHPK